MQLCKRNIRTHGLSEQLINTMIKGRLTKRIGQNNVSGREERFSVSHTTFIYIRKMAIFFTNFLDEKETIALLSITISPDRSTAIMRLSGLTLHHRDLRSNCYSSMHVINPATLRTLALSFSISLRDKKNVWSFIYIFFY